MDNGNPYLKYGPQPQQMYPNQYGYASPNYVSPQSYNNPMQSNNGYQSGPTLQSFDQRNVTPIFGRWVDLPNEVTSRDVPMDWTMALFPSRKGDKIYAMAWDSSGNIATIEFEQVKSDQNQSQTDRLDLLQDTIMAKLNKLDEKLTNRRYDQRKENKEV